MRHMIGAVGSPTAIARRLWRSRKRRFAAAKRWWRRRRQDATLALLDLRDRTLGRRDPLIPPRRRKLPGWRADSRKMGREWVRIFETEVGLRGDERILDIGCGPGRVAAALTRRLDHGSYEGFDVDRPSIGWCQEVIAPRHPNFRFQIADIYNASYNPEGSQQPASFRFPFPDSDFDLAFALSVFTHMPPTDTEHYLSEATRVLRPGGHLVATFFLVNDEILNSQAGDSPERRRRVQHELTDDENRPYRSAVKETPERMIAQYEDDVREMYDRAGLEIERITRGHWKGGFPGSGQDRIVAVSV